MNSQSDIEELKNMQREASEQRDKRKKERATASKTAQQRSSASQSQAASTKSAENDQANDNDAQTENMKSAEDDQNSKVQTEEAEQAIQDIAGNIETLVKKLEATASERPVLTIMAAFSLGIIVGQLFSRR
ncbi:MAG: hypothetical protein WBM38_04775 [Arenicellales bacterium]